MEKQFIPYQSEQLNELYTALARAQGQMKDAELNSKNPHFKSEYADLTAVVKAARPYLTQNGLAVIQQLMVNPEGITIMQTRLCHTSGQWIESRVPVRPDKDGVQGLGSYITYLRRYSYTALIGVVDEDDDGEASMVRVSDDKVTEEQARVLQGELTGYKDIAAQIFAANKVDRISDLPKRKFEDILKFAQQAKAHREKK